MGVQTDPDSAQPLPASRHIFSHVEWQMTGWQLSAPPQQPPEGCVWAGPEQLQTGYALPGAFKAYRKFLLG